MQDSPIFEKTKLLMPRFATSTANCFGGSSTSWPVKEHTEKKDGDTFVSKNKSAPVHSK